MGLTKRIFLFLSINILVIFMISIVLKVFGIAPYLSAKGLNYQALLIFCFIWGMVGSFISLALSKKMAIWMMGVKILSNKTTHSQEAILLSMVRNLAHDAKIPMPEVGIYNSPEVNAFATGPSKKSSLVAVSSGLLAKMNQEEVQAILGHEISHIANGDMVTMTLLQGVVNAFVMFLARALAYALSSMGKNNRGSYISYIGFVFLFEIIFMILGSIVVATFSRFREYRADLGGAYLAGKESMISALETLKSNQNIKDTKKQNPAFQALKISTSKKSFLALFATHPPLEKRIERLKNLSTSSSL